MRRTIDNELKAEATHESAEEYYGTKVLQMGPCNDLGELYAWEIDGLFFWCVDNTCTKRGGYARQSQQQYHARYCQHQPIDGKNDEEYNYVYQIPRSLFVELRRWHGPTGYWTANEDEFRASTKRRTNNET